MEYLEPKLRARSDSKKTAYQAILRYRVDSTQPWRQATKSLKAMTQNKAKAEMLEWADAFKAEQKAQQAEQSKPKQAHVFVSDYVDNYITDYEAIGAVEPSTIKGYRTTALYIREFFSDVFLDELTAPQVQSFETVLVQRGLSSSTIGKCHRLLKQVLKYAVSTDAIMKNPVDAVKPPKRKSTEPNALDAESRRKVAEYIATHEANTAVTGVALALYAGLHAAECCGLKWVDVDLENAQIRVSESIGIAEGGTYSKSPKNETRRRTIDIPPQLVEVLERRYQIMRDQAHSAGLRLMPTMYVLSYDLEHYASPTNLSKKWSTISEVLGVCGTRNKSVRFHDLRHTFATVAIAEGIDVKTVSSMMGHANAAMTLNIYASSDPNAKKAAAAKIGKAYEKQAQVFKFKRAGNE